MKIKIKFTDNELKLICSGLDYKIQNETFQQKDEMKTLSDSIKLSMIINKP